MRRNLASGCRAALEAVAYQTTDLLQALAADAENPVTALRVDGGMVANDWLMQFLADMTAVAVERPRVAETTALGAAYLAGLQAGLYDSLETIARQWQLDAGFEPAMAAADRERLHAGWKNAVSSVLTKK